MAQDGSYKILKFDGINYSFSKIRIESYLNFMGYGIWNSIVDGYTPPSTPPTNLDKIKMHENNGKTRNAIISELYEIEFLKVMDYKYAKEV